MAEAEKNEEVKAPSNFIHDFMLPFLSSIIHISLDQSSFASIEVPMVPSGISI